MTMIEVSWDNDRLVVIVVTTNNSLRALVFAHAPKIKGSALIEWAQMAAKKRLSEEGL